MKLRIHWKICSFLLAWALLILPIAVRAAVNPVWVEKVDVATEPNQTVITLHCSEVPQDLTVQANAGPSLSTLQFSGKLSGVEKSFTTHFDNRENLQGLQWQELEDQNHPGVPQFKIQIQRILPNTVSIQVMPQERQIKIQVAETNAAPQTDGQPLGSGVQYSRKMKAMAQGTMLINVLQVDPRAPGVDLAPAMPSPQYIRGLAQADKIVDQYKAVAAVNASFFKMDHQIPLGIVMINGELMSGPLFNRVAFGLGKDGSVHMEKIQMEGQLTLSSPANPSPLQIPLHNVNQPRVQLNQTVVYTTRWGSVAPPVPKNGYQVQITGQRITNVSNWKPLPIPKEGFVISGPKASLESAVALQAQPHAVDIRLFTRPDWSGMKHAISGGPYLVKNGHIYIDAFEQKFNISSLRLFAPRTALGIMEDGRILLVTANGLRNDETGPSLKEMAFLMQSLGAKEAMNLDGGGSTQMVIQGQEVHKSRRTYTRPVSTCLLIRAKEGNWPDFPGRMADISH